MAGAIIALIPFTNGVYCFAIPVGIWALIALNGRGARAAFRRTGRSAPPSPTDLADDLDR